MINRAEVVKSIDLISESIIIIAESVLQERINAKINFEHDNLTEFLSPYEGLAVTKLITDRYFLDDQKFINLGIIHLPIRYLACYILLNAELKQ